MTRPYERLAGAIIIQALRDIQTGHEYSEEAIAWLHSPIAQGWLEHLGINNRGVAELQRLIEELPDMPRLVLVQPPSMTALVEKKRKLRQIMLQRINGGTAPEWIYLQDSKEEE